jgi:hypothetical protein
MNLLGAAAGAVGVGVGAAAAGAVGVGVGAWYNVENQADIPRPVWFVYEGNTLYLLPNYGSDTNWYKNVLVDPTLKVSVNGIEIPATGELITDSNRVADIVRKFNSKYGEVKRYYTKFDVAVEVPL